VARYQEWESYSVEEVQKFLGENGSQQPGQPGWFQFGLEAKEAGGLIGDCGLRIDPANTRLGQVGYTIAAEHWGRGYASEALRGLVDFAFRTLPNLHRLAADADPRNRASLRVLVKCGFRQEGHQVQSWWSKGEWTDNSLFAMLRRDWADRSEGPQL
jgi:RimJ/RimL family protein N-acetyltransferase